MAAAEAPIKRRWTADDIGDLTGTTVVITGANSGLGLTSAEALAEHGATVIMAGRNPLKLSEAAASVGGPATSTVRLDLADLESVRRAADEIAEQADRIDVLMNNAGVMAPPLSRTKDGFELQIGTNHLGHFALTGLLLPLLHHEAARVVNVSSTAHTMGAMDLDDLNYEQRKYSAWSAYGQSKLANLLFTAELDRRAAAAGWDLLATAAHPGYAATNLQFSGPGYAQNPIGKGLSWLGNLVLAQSAEAGAWPQLYAAVAPVQGDDYIGPTGFRGMRGHPGQADRTGAARDEDTARQLWELSEELTGVTYDWS